MSNHDYDVEAVAEVAEFRAALRRCLARDPSPGELTSLAEFLDSQRKQFEAAPQEAARVAPSDGSSPAEPARAAAWTMLARVLLNLDEFITRE